MIIVEGSDHLGKTTFCKALAELLATHPQGKGWMGRLHHMTKPEEHFDYFSGYLGKLRHGNVYDRFHLGAYTYGVLCRCHPTQQWSPMKMNLVHRFIRHIAGGIVVLFHTGNLSWYEHHLYENAKDEMFNLQTILKANLAFRSIPFLNCSPLYPDLVIDYTFTLGVNGRFPDENDVRHIANMWLRKNGYSEFK